ncbi:aldehyde dehydrogenase, thermostable-like isoform X2 [Benincasa hispida]|uniref:aldehyde dehydrogenase, thermostable-like isoform X2 n=2 Tax=Benincasa hispida TaxID=102211 RepID=UPI00190038B3|nr:aldehyde dehydrogenase, thermostable-like isoform X2 [Benincasa hispida]XP_038877340.1 aldehyde dehydrogenase, thermostable-like isoform X2 [Benincasa hispida]
MSLALATSSNWFRLERTYMLGLLQQESKFRSQDMKMEIFVGPTILSDVTTDMECYKEEFFGPVLLCMQVDNLEEAISIVNRNKYFFNSSKLRW